ncbi:MULTISPECIES: L,D-transpeptidase family protein [unclassified Microbacterium]|uniref:L,D-transpeptidase family protein n=1 Tax=unclassified Microbacterium TaxID=2609290 RepID=UPI00214B603B|nr:MULTISPECIES: L,D-transpeptidase family protein [unclassified Microbacterium]MCR2785113.1 L,D-transpeptidase/peptidoglycan binding protein [Microbacterium sp. zg.B96]WIM16647.1 L,D-transpeptidase family protein [Microbacterium sp. zg-B96]
MTDVVTRPEADETGAVATDDAPTLALGAGGDEAGTTEVKWASAEPPRKKRRLALWIGIPVAVAALGAGAASLMLIAPGTTVAGVSVGLLTPGAASDAISERLQNTELVVGDGDAVSSADLGAELDVRAIAESAFETRPAWNVTQWFGDPISAPITIDAQLTAEILREAAPSLYTAPTDAMLAFDAGTQTYVVTPAVDGSGVDPAAVEAGLQQAFNDGAATVVLDDPALAPIPANTTTDSAQSSADVLNAMLDSAGFYIGEERTVPVDRAVLASWITLSTTEDGTFEFTADPAAIQPVVDTLPALVARDAVNATVITNTAGEHLYDIQSGQAGRALESTDGIAAGFAEQLSTGNAVYPLPVVETQFQTTALERTIDVNLSAQRVTLYENGAAVDSWSVSTGKQGAPTYTGNYTIQSMYPMQTLYGTYRGPNGEDLGPYVQPNVKWMMYFNGGQAFHGVYWHSNWGRPSSHGCVGMPEWRAAQLYDWAAPGVEVSIHN